MSQIEKLILKFYKRPTPTDITMQEVIKLSKYYGCIVKKGGNHQICIAHIPTGTIIPIPQHGKHIKQAYIEELCDLFDDIKKEESNK